MNPKVTGSEAEEQHGDREPQHMHPSTFVPHLTKFSPDQQQEYLQKHLRPHSQTLLLQSQFAQKLAQRSQPQPESQQLNKREYMGSDESKYSRKRPQWPSPSPDIGGELAQCLADIVTDIKEEANFSKAIHDCEDARKGILEELHTIDCDRETNKTALIQCYQDLWACQGTTFDKRKLPQFVEANDKVTVKMTLSHLNIETVDKIAERNGLKRQFPLPNPTEIQELAVCREKHRMFVKWADSRWRYLRTCIHRLDEAAELLDIVTTFTDVIITDLNQVCIPALTLCVGA